MEDAGTRVRSAVVLIGAQVRQTGGFLAGLHRGEEMGAEVVQLFPQNNRQWRAPAQDHDVYAAYREAAGASRVVVATVCHAPYLINVLSPDPVTQARSCASLADNLRAATALGARALIVHPGSHRGVDPDTAAERVARYALAALDEVADVAGEVCDLLLENTAGAGGTVGRTFEELAAVIDAAGGDDRIGVCLDTQHLWASGVSFSTARQADEVVDRLDREVGLERLRCLHVNDSKVPFGANRDRHENLGQGAIGPRPLRAFLGQPRLQGLPAVLEVKGIEGKGPGSLDLEVARSLHRGGLAARRRRGGVGRER